MGTGGVGPKKRLIRLLQEGLDDALQSIGGVNVEVKNAASGAMESAILAACMREHVGVGDADLFFGDLCTNDGFTQRNATSIEDVVQQAVGTSGPRHHSFTPSSVFLVCSPSNAWWMEHRNGRLGLLWRRQRDTTTRRTWTQPRLSYHTRHVCGELGSAQPTRRRCQRGCTRPWHVTTTMRGRARTASWLT